jgi:putative endonuclease
MSEKAEETVSAPAARSRGRRRVSSEDGAANAAVGAWGEDAAAEFLCARGWSIIERNARPCARDRRCEIDIVAQPSDPGKVVFVEVKTHARREESAGRLAGVDANKKRNLLRACANWVMRRRWHGDFRLDVVEVYGSPGAAPSIDHVENVPLFPPKWRFW